MLNRMKTLPFEAVSELLESQSYLFKLFLAPLLSSSLESSREYIWLAAQLSKYI